MAQPSAKLLIFSICIILITFLDIGISSRPKNRRINPYSHSQSVSLCDASRESSEECFDKVPKKHPKFLLYKYENLSEGEHVALSMDVKNISYANPHKKTVWKILIHGFLNNANSTFPVNVRDAYVERSRKTSIPYNILIVDWGELACASVANTQGYLYNYAAQNTAHVGRALGQLLAFLHTNDFLDMTKDVHIIGFSLGAHVAGQAGREVFDILGKTVRRITGLDPAGPAFWAWKFLPDFIIPRRRLQRKDTQFADIYHTSSFFGSSEVMGDVDFWINGGSSQPECVPKTWPFIQTRIFTQVCSHNYVTRLFAKSILDNSMRACLCPSYRSYNWGSCACSEKAVVGEMLDNSTATVGEYYYNPPRDDSVMESILGSWTDFSLQGLIRQWSNMVC